MNRNSTYRRRKINQTETSFCFQGAGGVGKVTAKWIVDGHPPGNMLNFEVQRFTKLHNNARYLRERTYEVVGKHYALAYPIVDEFKRARKVRTSPLFSELEGRGAVYGERMGWERPLYFDPYHSREDPPAQLPEKGTFAKPHCYEHIEVRNLLGLFECLMINCPLF